jgi:hypothetical protein
LTNTVSGMAVPNVGEPALSSAASLTIQPTQSLLPL